MGIYMQCWKTLNCRQVSCPVYGSEDPDCWTMTTDCYFDQERITFKFLRCIQCSIFENNAPEETKMLARTIIDFESGKAEFSE
jgi:hypothetical protein